MQTGAPTMEFITRERLFVLSVALSGHQAHDENPTLPLPPAEILYQPTPCVFHRDSGYYMTKGYLVPGIGYCCETCAVLRLIRGLVHYIDRDGISVPVVIETTTALLPAPAIEGEYLEAPEPEPEPIPSLMDDLNRQIAIGLGFDPAVLEATGSKLASLATVVGYERGNDTDGITDVLGHLDSDVIAANRPNPEAGFEIAKPVSRERTVAPRPPEPVGIDPSLRRFNRSTDYNHGKHVIYLEKGQKLNVMDLPPGTIIRYNDIKAGKAEMDQGDAEFYKDPKNTPSIDHDQLPQDDDPILHGVTVKPYREDEPVSLWSIPVDHSALTQEQSDEIETTIRRRGSLKTAADVFSYEQEFGDPGIMAALEEEDAEYEAQFAGSAFAEALEKQRAGQRSRTSEVGTFRTMKSEEELKHEREVGEAVTAASKPGTFPTLAPRSNRS